jgi:Tfp pilus assembly protein PilX
MNIKPKITNERGSIIIVSLLTLSLLSLLGIASITKSQTDVSIAGNDRENKSSLYAAEVSLVVAETSIPQLHKYKKLDEVNEMAHHGIGDEDKDKYIIIDNDQLKNSPDKMKDARDSDQPISFNSKMRSSGLRYAIKQFEFVPDCDTLGVSCSNTGIDIYKVVGVGEGSSHKTSTMLETTFHWRHR